MKFRLGSDFYKALALFSQAGCPFTQAGSLPPQVERNHPLTVSSAAAPGGSDYQTGGAARSLPSTAESDQITLIPSHVTSIRSSYRPSKSSSTACRSDPHPSKYSTMAYDTSRGLPCSENPHVSPFSANRSRLPALLRTGAHQHETRSSSSLEVPRNNILPSSSDPIGAAAGAAVSCADDTSQPAFASTEPRPWTAPTFVPQRYSQMLPPKRELPFKASSTTSETRREFFKNGQAGSETVARNSLDSISGITTGSNPQTKQGVDHGSSDQPKKAPTKRGTKAIRGTRSATTASRSRKKSSAVPEESPVPSVDELLRRSQRISERRVGVASRSHDDGEASMDALSTSTRHAERPEEDQPGYEPSNIDTQTLLARVDERQRLREPKRKDSTKFHEESDLLPCAKRIAPNSRSIATASPSRAAAAQTPAADYQGAVSESLKIGNMRHSNAPAVPYSSTAHDIHHYMSQERDEMPPSAQKPIEQVSAMYLDTGNSNPPERRPLADISNSVQPSRPHPVASGSLMALMRDPDFARSPEIAQWADLPREEQDAALETWMCQQLESESFAALLRTLEGKWQRIFFGR
jgi:hypothetical protein